MPGGEQREIAWNRERDEDVALVHRLLRVVHTVDCLRGTAYDLEPAFRVSSLYKHSSVTIEQHHHHHQQQQQQQQQQQHATTMTTNVLSCTELSVFNASVIRQQNATILVFFYAKWHEQSKPGGQMDSIVDALAAKHSGILFVKVEAEEAPEISGLLGVSVVPTFVSLLAGKESDRVEGVNPADLNKLVKKLAESTARGGAANIAATSVSSSSAAPANDAVPEAESLDSRLEKLINMAPVVLFMKGAPEAPRCGFSRQICDVLKESSIPFASFDILSDNDVREGLKKHSDWPTYPQLYVNGTLVGGLDVVKEMMAEGDLKEQLGL